MFRHAWGLGVLMCGVTLEAQPIGGILDRL